MTLPQQTPETPDTAVAETAPENQSPDTAGETAPPVDTGKSAATVQPPTEESSEPVEAIEPSAATHQTPIETKNSQQTAATAANQSEPPETPPEPQPAPQAPAPVAPQPLQPVEYRHLSVTPPDSEPESYTGYEVLSCQCQLNPEYQAIAAVLGMCHHTSSIDVEDLNNRLLSLLADQPVAFSMSEYLKRTPEQLRDKYIREILTTDYAYRTQEEHTALAIACLRQNVMGIMALITGYLLDLPRNRPPAGVPEPDAEDDDYALQPAGAAD